MTSNASHEAAEQAHLGQPSQADGREDDTASITVEEAMTARMMSTAGMTRGTLLLLVTLGGCSAAFRGEPPLTVLQHETLATQAEQRAAQLGQGDATERDRLRRVAVEQRESAGDLRRNEETTCVGISASDRAVGPLGAKELIVTTEPLFVRLRQGSRLRGATVVFRAVPGLTAEWLQRLSTCQVAHLAAIGYGPEMERGPLAFSQGVTVQVNSTGTGFALTIQSDDFDTAREIARRASALFPAAAR